MGRRWPNGDERSEDEPGSLRHGGAHTKRPSPPLPCMTPYTWPAGPITGYQIPPPPPPV